MSTAPGGSTPERPRRKRSGQASQVTRVWLMIGGLLALAAGLLILAALLVLLIIAWF